MRNIVFGMLLLYCSPLIAQRSILIGYGKKADPPYNVTGTVFNSATGERISGANVFIERQNIGMSSDEEGKFNFSLYEGLYIIQVSIIGYETQVKKIDLKGPGNVNFRMKENILELDEVVFQSEGADKNVASKTIGKEVLKIESIKTLPPLGGEVNVLRSLTLLPGVSTQGEASSGFNVRGGGIDQNLVMLGGATLYNPYHLFGFFSGFNASVVRDVTLHKGAIPANYGGRASSVVDVTYKKGNFRQWGGDVTAGTTASKFSIRGPVVNEKLSVMVAGRIAYPNWLLRQTKDANIANSTASFFDANAVVNYIINKKNNLEYSFYISGDQFQFADNVENRWQNTAQVFRWNSTINEQLSFDVSGVRSTYTSNLIDDTPLNDFDLETQIIHNELNLNFNFSPSQKQTIKVGVQTKFLENKLGKLMPAPGSSVLPATIDAENAIESGVYFQHDIDLIGPLGLSYGLRYSDFKNRGPGTVNEYDPNRTKSVNTIISTREFDGEDIQSYNGFEPRAALKYQLNKSTSIKGGYSRVYQYIHLITNTTSVSPTDVWKLSDPFLEPQIVSQYSLGLFKNFKNNRIETSIQGFYKDLENLVDFKDGADLFVNPNLETELISGTGQAYGVELFINKNYGRLNGWVSYTYSRSLREVNGPFDEEKINDGETFSSNFDTPHVLNLIANYRLGKNVTFSSVFNYSTGRPFTIPEGKFQYRRRELAFYGERNNLRGPANHRLDVSLQFNFPSKRKVFGGKWTLAVYNLYGRKNPFSVFFQDFPGQQPGAFKLSVVGAPFPSISYEVEF
ncbi:TonB-dependent receptor [Fulvivirga sp. M361]|uniref:TonB-dependent receptor n=1 Tax=Fulvivirga sp. M361 TaxID=2594266 RepID=UPI00117A9644|nr:TonB-dependent receptor [Fulvivirga sp. M361]TRX57689.1 TonB-dependent receptor [Fulvivirga sp. M361]